MGVLSGGVITQGPANSDGVALAYNLAGERIQAIYARDGHREDYNYSTEGYLGNSYINSSGSTTQGPLAASRSNDYLGRTTTYTETNPSGTVTYTRSTVYDLDGRSTSQSGTDGATTYGYYTSTAEGAGSGTAANGAGELAWVSNVNGGTTVNTWYRYTYWDQAKQLYGCNSRL
jgi:hypothetical protein